VSNAEQARLLGEAIATKVRAIVIAPVDYSGLLPYLRAAHDAQVPVVLTGTPRDRLNPSFVASFVAPDQASLDDRTAAELTRLLNAASGDVAVISAQPATRTAGASIAGLKRALQRARPNLRLLAVDVDTASADRAASQVTQLFMTRPRLAGVVAIDVFATRALRAQLATLARRRPAVVITSVTSASLGLLSRSLVDAVVGTDFCATARSAMTNALAAAKNDVTAINPGPVVALRTITRTTVGTVATTCS
jgi:ABC-type sugar transport system substrate-binding protein